MPLFKCSSGKATPKKVIAYITDKNKAELVSVRNLFEDEDYARQFTDTQNLFGKGKNLMRGNTIISNYRVPGRTM